MVHLIFFICALFLLFSPCSWCLHILGYGTAHWDVKPWDDETDKKDLEVELISEAQIGIRGKTVVVVLNRMFPICV